jgi:uncharacterized alkaline shock family protein YloU
MENTDKKNKGQIRIADDVIASIAGTAAMEADGIVALAGGSAIIDKLSKKAKRNGHGVAISVEDKSVSVELNVCVAYGCSIRTAAEEAQSKVKDAVETMTGLKVERVNINIAAIEFEKNEEAQDGE